MATRPMKVLADHGVPSRFAEERIVIPRARLTSGQLFQTTGLRWIGQLLYAIQCWWTGLRCPFPGPFVTQAGGHGFLLALLQLLSRPLGRGRTHLMVDLLLEPRRRGLLGLFDRLKSALFTWSVDAAVVWGQADVDIYAQEHGLPRHKLIFKQFHITLDGYEFEIRDDGFIFAGGNHGRDFATIIDALGPLDYPVFIATQAAGVSKLAEPYPHITVRGVSHEEFRQKMAASKLVVEAHPRDFFRTAGHQSFLNAMWMGKPVVMADQKSALGYFESGTHWLVVEAEDVDALRASVERLLQDKDLAREIAQHGQAVVRRPEYTTLGCIQDIYNIALGIEAKRLGLETGPRIDRY